MANNTSVIEALLLALKDNEDDLSLHLHVAGLLLDDGRLSESQNHYAVVLSKEPANLAALSGAAKVARLLDNDEQAEGYEKLLSALGGSVSPSTEVDSKAEQELKKPPSHFAGGSPLRVINGGQSDEDNTTLDEDNEPVVTLADVGGMEAVKKRINLAFLAPLKNPEVMKMYGKSLRGGLLLYGPPGCGKTFIARALAGELGAKFMSVGLSDVLDMYMGESERKLHELFETARRNAPTVLFFDEIDALGQKRSQQRNSGGRNLVNQLLSELDNVDSNNKDLFILGATNHPWDVDTALRRPGRFDRVVLVLPPDQAARKSILDYHLKEKPLQDVDVASLAAHSDGFSGADLAHLCESAVEFAMEESLLSGNIRPIKQEDFSKAITEIKPSTRPWFETARNYAMFANEGGVYDDLLAYIQSNKI